MVAALMPVMLEGVCVRQRGAQLIGPVTLALTGEGTTTVIGPNGSGKTTLMRALHGLIRLSEGRVAWPVSTDEARRRQAFVFQTPVMLRRSVLDNIAFPLRLAGEPRRRAREAAAVWGERVGLGAALRRPAEVLSGGERQKLALARALIRQPELLILDEPTASLDGRATREIESILQDAVEGGTRVVMATHDMGQVRRLARDVVFLRHGRVAAHQDVTSFFEAPAVPEAGAFVRGDIVE